MPSESSAHPPFRRSPQQPPVNPDPFHMPAGTPWQEGNTGAVKRAEELSWGSQPGVHRIDPQPECRRPAHPVSSPLALMPLDEAPLRMSKSPPDKQPLFAPCPALHRHFACQTFLRVWRPALWPVPLGLLPNPEVGGLAPGPEGEVGSKQGRGDTGFSPNTPEPEGTGQSRPAFPPGTSLLETCTPRPFL